MLTAPSSAKRVATDTSDASISLASWRLLWLLFILVHFALGFLAAGQGVVHLILPSPRIYAISSSISIQTSVLYATGVSYCLLASVHVWLGFRIVPNLFSQRKRLALSQLHVHPIVAPSRKASRRASRVGVAAEVVKRRWLDTFGLDGNFGFNGPNFHTYFQCVELCQVLAQTYQCYQLSTAVVDSTVISIAVGIMVMNCLSTPLLSLVIKREQRYRMIIVVVDLALDFGTTVVIPTLVLAPYVLAFDWTARVFPPRLTLDEVWPILAVLESRQVLVVSFKDYLATVVSQLVLLFNLTVLFTLLKRRMEGLSTEAAVVKHTQGVLLRCMRAITAIWAAVVVFLHSKAQKPSVPAALDEAMHLCSCTLHPWFEEEGRYACAVARIDCQWLGIDGDTSSLHDLLSLFDRHLLSKVTFTHCPRLEIPPTITSFKAVQTVFIVNCSLASWPADAAMTPASSPMFSSVFFLNVSLNELPAGLYHRDLPPSLTIFEFLHTNLTQLPEDIGDVWAYHQWVHVGFDATPLASLPPSFSRLSVSSRLSLTQTRLTAVGSELIKSNKQLRQLYLSGSPALNTLDPAIGELASLQTLYLEYTQLSELPDWLVDWWSRATAYTRLSLFGSPYCDRDDALEALCSTDYRSRTGFYDYQAFVQNHIE